MLLSFAKHLDSPDGVHLSIGVFVQDSATKVGRAALHGCGIAGKLVEPLTWSREKSSTFDTQGEHLKVAIYYIYLKHSRYPLLVDSRW